MTRVRPSRLVNWESTTRRGFLFRVAHGRFEAWISHQVQCLVADVLCLGLMVSFHEDKDKLAGVINELAVGHLRRLRKLKWRGEAWALDWIHFLALFLLLEQFPPLTDTVEGRLRVADVFEAKRVIAMLDKERFCDQETLPGERRIPLLELVKQVISRLLVLQILVERRQFHEDIEVASTAA